MASLQVPLMTTAYTFDHISLKNKYKISVIHFSLKVLKSIEENDLTFNMYFLN